MKSNLARACSPVVYPVPALSVRDRADIVRYEESLGDFVAAAWHHASEPKPFQSNWHIDCVSDYLMAVARRELTGPGPLIFTMPWDMKSLGANVFFPAWVWAQHPDPDGLGYMVLPYDPAHSSDRVFASPEREQGTKENRANPFAAQCEHGFVALVEGRGRSL